MGDICQWNVVVLYICGQKFGVKGTVLDNFETLLTKFCSLLYTDSHYYRLKVRGCSFPNVIEKFFLGFDNPPSLLQWSQSKAALQCKSHF